MLTPFGKKVRTHRIEHEMTLREMADQLGLSPAFLSAVETGRKQIPKDFPDKVSDLLSLDIAARAELRAAADRSAKDMRLSFSQDASERDREVATLFARQFNKLSDDEIDAIRNILDRRRR